MNVDFNPECELSLDLREPLPFSDNSCALIYSEHFFEHLEHPVEISLLLSESLRVLQAGGTFSLGVPDTEWPLLAYGNPEKYDYFDYANKVVQFMLLPRIICIGLSAFMLAVSVFMGTQLFCMAALVNLTLAVSLILPLEEQMNIRQILSMALELPRVFANMVLALLTANKAAGKFLHTPHNSK